MLLNVVIYVVTKLKTIMLTKLFQGVKRHLNSVFYNFHQMVDGWAEGHTHKHLKREVLVNLIEHRESYATKLQHILISSRFVIVMLCSKYITEMVIRIIFLKHSETSSWPQLV